MTDTRTDAPRDPQFLAVPVAPLVVPAFERVYADLRRRNPMASDVQLMEQFGFEAIVLMDGRIPTLETGEGA
jgi:hypothetical protein